MTNEVAGKSGIAGRNAEVKVGSSFFSLLTVGIFTPDEDADLSSCENLWEVDEQRSQKSPALAHN